MKSDFVLFLVFSCSFAFVIRSDKAYEFPHTKAQFGLDYLNNSTDVCNIWLIAYSGILKAVEPFNACSTLNMNLTGYIGLAIRDKLQSNCSFSVKAANVLFSINIWSDRSKMQGPLELLLWMRSRCDGKSILWLSWQTIQVLLVYIIV